MIEFKNVSYSYLKDTSKAIDELSFKAPDGMITLICGKSGCGKSTLIRLVNGLCPNYYKGIFKGDILIDGISYLDCEDLGIISKKVGSLFQNPERQFFALTVEDEIAFSLQWKNLSLDELNSRLEQSLKRFNLTDIRKSKLSDLSSGQKQKVGLAALYALGVKNIILDEPTSNLDNKSINELKDILKELANDGFCIMICDHRLYYLKETNCKILLLDKGRKVYFENFNSLENNPEIHSLRSFNLEKPFKWNDVSANKRPIFLKGDGICFKYKDGPEIFNDFSFNLYEGVNILLGANGCGKTTLCRLIFGLEKLNKGSFKFQNYKKPVIAMVLQNQDYQLHMQSVEEELLLSLMLSKKKIEKSEVHNLLLKFDLQDLKKRHPHSLSVGQKQRLVILCALALNPNLLILDEPTSGLDGENLQRVKDLLCEFNHQKGKALLVITHDPELLDKNYNIFNLGNNYE